jgi:gas vesicle protein
MIAKILIGAVVGGALGYAAYRVVGCGTGLCPLTANPWTSTLYGMLLGGLLGSAFK